MSLARNTCAGSLSLRQATGLAAIDLRGRGRSDQLTGALREASTSLEKKCRFSLLQQRTHCWGCLNFKETYQRSDLPAFSGRERNGVQASSNAGSSRSRVTESTPAAGRLGNNHTESEHGRDSVVGGVNRTFSNDIAAAFSGRVVLPSLLWGMLGLLWLVCTR